MVENKKSDLTKLKENYKELQEKHDLPNFDELNSEFGVERISDIETDFLLREVRKFIADKISDYMRFVEMLLNPVNAPMFYFAILKTLNDSDKKLIGEIYKKLMKLEVELIEADIEYNEENELKAIKNSCKVWHEVKKDALLVFKTIKNNWDNKVEKNNRGYFG